MTVELAEGTYGFNPHQVEQLAKRAITPAQARQFGIVPVQKTDELPPGAPSYWTEEAHYLPATLHPWRGTDGELSWQIKPDIPLPDPDDPERVRKYLFASGWKPVLHQVRSGNSDNLVIIEGTHQRIAAGLYAPDGWSVYGIAGCRSWSSKGLPIPDLLVCEDKNVTVVLDADMNSNMDVWNAGQALAKELDLAGARSVKFASISGGRNTGLDDILGSRDDRARFAYVERVLDPSRCLAPKAVKKPPRDAIRAAEKEERDRAREARRDADRAREKAEGRPLVDTSGDRYDLANQLSGILQARWDGVTLFSRGTPPVLYQRNEGTLSSLSRDTLRDRISVCARTGRANQMTGAWEDGWPDDGTLGVLLSRGRDFKPIKQIVNSPFVRQDGTVCAVNGYDGASQTYVRMPPELIERLHIPDDPTGEEVQSAVKLLLDDWLGDMPFATQADRASALAMILTPFVRGWMDVVPIAVVDGNGPSAGKGLLASLWSTLVLGRPAILKSLPDDNEEMRKAVTSALIAGRPLLIWDEAHTLEGKVMAQLLTAPTWSDRRLGSNVDVEIDNQITFAALGNNVRVEGDVGRRAYRIRIHPRMERPEDRDASQFRHPDIRQWTQDNRADLLSAVLVLIRSWVVAGSVPGRADMGSFEKWSKTIGGILDHAGVEGFLDGRKEWLGESNTSTELWASHLQWLHSTFGDRIFKSSDAAREMVTAGIHAPLPTSNRNLASPEATADYSQRLGMVYRHHAEQTFFGVTLRRVGTDKGSATYQVEELVTESNPLTHPGVFWNPSEGGVKGLDTDSLLLTPRTQEGGTSPQENTSEGVKGLEGFSPYIFPVARRKDTVFCGAQGGIPGLGNPPNPLTPQEPENPEDDPFEDFGRFLKPAKYLGVVGPVAIYMLTTSKCDLIPVDPAVTATLDHLMSGIPDAESTCPTCGATEALVDGMWFACPTCNPATAQRGTAPWIR